MRRFSYSPQAVHLSWSFGTRWGDSLTRPRLDISRCHSARGGEILLLTQVWTSLIIVRRVVGRFSYSPQAGHLLLSFGAWWGDSFTRPGLDISCRRSARGGEILLLTPGWTSIVVIRRAVGRFFYSSRAGHLSSSFGARWGDSLTRPGLDRSSFGARRGDSLTHPGLDIYRRQSVRGGKILLLAPC